MINEGSPEQDKDHPIGKKHHKKKDWKTLHKMDNKMIKDYIAHLDEASGLSTNTLKSYEDKAAADAKKKREAGDYSGHSKRYRGIFKSQMTRMDRSTQDLKKSADALHQATKDWKNKKGLDEWTYSPDAKHPDHAYSGALTGNKMKAAHTVQTHVQKHYASGNPVIKKKDHSKFHLIHTVGAHHELPTKDEWHRTHGKILDNPHHSFYKKNPDHPTTHLRNHLVKNDPHYKKVFQQIGQHRLKKAIEKASSHSAETKKAVNENFMDGRNPQDKGDSKRHGLSGKMSVKSLKKARSSDNSSPRKKQLAHWLLNMRKGREKS